MSTEVREILDRIGRLPDTQRSELLQELAARQEQQWVELSRQARQIARERGIDDQSIARAVESLRYGDDADNE